MGNTPSTLSIHYRFHHPKQVHVLLAKAEADAWWKKLMEGGEERGYYELLKEAVDAGR